MQSATRAVDPIDARCQVGRRAQPQVTRKGGRNVVNAAGGQDRTRLNGVRDRIMSEAPQQLFCHLGITAGRVSCDMAIDRHPGALVVDERSVLVEQDAPDRHRPPPSSSQATQTAPDAIF